MLLENQARNNSKSNLRCSISTYEGRRKGYQLINLK